MGGRAGRTLFAIVSALVLSLSSIGGAGTALATDACTEGGYAAPPPGAAYAGSDAIVVRVTWANADDMQLQYVVTDAADPVNEPFTGPASPAVNGGCTSEAIISGCAAPLILALAPPAGRNGGLLRAGHYTIAAAPGGACVYYSGEGGKPEYATAPAEIPVTATIEYYSAGEQAPSLTKALAPVMVPTFEELPRDLRPHRRILGTFDWDPASGISGVVAAGASAGGDDGSQTVELPPLPPGVAAAAPPASYGDSPSQDAPAGDDTPVSADDADVAGGSKDGPSPPRRDMTRDDVLFVVLVALLVNPQKVLKQLLTGGLTEFLTQATAKARPSAAKVVELDQETPGESESSGIAPEAPPDTKLKPGRRWVQPGEEFSVRHDGEKHDLLPGTWYQAKEVDGKLRLFDQDGRLLGSVKASGPEAPMLWSQRSGQGDSSEAAPLPAYEKLAFKPQTAMDLMRYLFAFQVVDERLPQAQRERAERQLELFNQILVDDPG